ncbi:Putative ankyrin repeat protein [Frankliniella fusca]|uniref:Ankyrin repeat protein n=1 Tax=Frankliniella fusca TaxID=407009 RepID=A0AAE1HBU7_9NEOP|nr:Putative ankyrin repeat protein [Frankliniella fusca]
MDTAAAPSSASQGNYTDEELKKCRNNWLDVTNSTVNENLDILAILLENGGFPGQLEKGVQWEANKTDADPNRWTYFYGDTDYKTYIRLERGEVSSRTPPVPGTEPRELTGDIWWTPDDFCGKLRHAKYSKDTELRASNQPKVCFIEEERVTCWSAPECVEPLEPGFTCPRGGVNSALMASLVG